MIDESMELDMDAFISSVNEEDKSNAQSNQTTFNFPTTVGIGQKAILRFIYGLPASPIEERFKNPYVAKLANISWIKDDSGKMMKLVLPAIVNNKPQTPHILCDFIDDVLRQVWVEFSSEEIQRRQSDPNIPNEKKNAKGEYRYIYKDRNDYGAQSSGNKTISDIYQFVAKSGHQPNELYYASQKSWRGQTVYVANVIDRKDPKWHETNKKTKLLMGSVKVKGDKISNKEASWFRMASITDLVKNSGSKMNYDVLIQPTYANGKEVSNSPYIFSNLSSRAEKDYWSDMTSVLSQEEISQVKGFDLSEEEKQYDLIDISKYYSPTSYSVILKRLGKTIEAYDLMLGTNFYEQIKAEADKEKAAKSKTEDPKVNPYENTFKESSSPKSYENVFTESKENTFKGSSSSNLDVNAFYDAML